MRIGPAFVAAALSCVSATSFALLNGVAPDAFYNYVGTLPAGYVATPIASRWIVTANHVSPLVGDHFVNADGSFVIDQVVAHPVADFCLAHVTTTMAHSYSLATTDITNPLTFTMDGGTLSSGPLVTFLGTGPTGTPTSTGWSMNADGGPIRQAQNRIEGRDDVSLTENGPLFKGLFYDLDGNDVSSLGPYDPLAAEGGLVYGDSGGSWFVNEGGQQKVIAVSLGIFDGMDLTDGYGSDGTIGGSYFDYGDGGVGTDLAAYSEFIQNTINPVPEPSSVAVVGLGLALLVRRRRH